MKGRKGRGRERKEGKGREGGEGNLEHDCRLAKAGPGDMCRH